MTLSEGVSRGYFLSVYMTSYRSLFCKAPLHLQSPGEKLEDAMCLCCELFRLLSCVRAPGCVPGACYTAVTASRNNCTTDR